MFIRSFVSDSCDPMDCSLPGSSVYGILQARILDWVAISFSRGSKGFSVVNEAEVDFFWNSVAFSML